jgi:hypothetical protein
MGDTSVTELHALKSLSKNGYNILRRPSVDRRVWKTVFIAVEVHSRSGVVDND